MSFRVTRNSDGSITAESDTAGNEVDHVYAQQHHRELSGYMRETCQSAIEGRDYNDVINSVVDAKAERDGRDHALTRMEVSNKLVW